MATSIIISQNDCMYIFLGARDREGGSKREGGCWLQCGELRCNRPAALTFDVGPVLKSSADLIPYAIRIMGLTCV